MDLDDMDLDDRHLDDADLDVRGVRWETNVPLTPPIVAPFMHGHSTTAPEATAPPPRVGVASVQGEVEWDEIETYEAHSRTVRPLFHFAFVHFCHQKTRLSVSASARMAGLYGLLRGMGRWPSIRRLTVASSGVTSSAETYCLPMRTAVIFTLL